MTVQHIADLEPTRRIAILAAQLVVELASGCFSYGLPLARVSSARANA